MTNAPAPLSSAVLAALPSVPEAAKFGRKAYLAGVAATLGLTPAELARRVLAEQRAMERPTLALSRGDLIAAMDASLVRASEVDLDGAIVHFVALA